MLKTNSKKARENIRSYILSHYDGTGYNGAPEPSEPFEKIASFILNTYEAEKYYARPVSNEDSFIDWCAGLPSIIDTCYYYNRSAVADLGDVLEETETEREKYTETQAEKMLSHLIYMELKRGAKK